MGIINDSIGSWQADGDLVASVRAIATGREKSEPTAVGLHQNVAAIGDSAAGADMRTRQWRPLAILWRLWRHTHIVSLHATKTRRYQTARFPYCTDSLNPQLSIATGTPSARDTT